MTPVTGISVTIILLLLKYISIYLSIIWGKILTKYLICCVKIAQLLAIFSILHVMYRWHKNVKTSLDPGYYTLSTQYIYGFIILWAPFLVLPMYSFHCQAFGSPNFQKQIISFLKVVPGFRNYVNPGSRLIWKPLDNGSWNKLSNKFQKYFLTMWSRP